MCLVNHTITSQEISEYFNREKKINHKTTGGGHRVSCCWNWNLLQLAQWPRLILSLGQSANSMLEFYPFPEFWKVPLLSELELERFVGRSKVKVNSWIILHPRGTCSSAARYLYEDQPNWCVWVWMKRQLCTIEIKWVHVKTIFFGLQKTQVTL